MRGQDVTGVLVARLVIGDIGAVPGRVADRVNQQHGGRHDTSIREGCPEIVIVLDHCWSRHTWLDYLTIGEEDESLWFTMNELPPRMTTEIAGRLGIDRLVAGSWYPEHSPALVIDRLKQATGLHSRTLASTLTKNAAQILSGRHARHKPVA